MTILVLLGLIAFVLWWSYPEIEAYRLAQRQQEVRQAQAQAWEMGKCAAGNGVKNNPFVEA
ncbi:MAG TPA: hypothetical protein VFH56_03370 [Acidimicrobiales bacterium]|nr:hypothetical protein [Acidimicrobiales bacterium]